MSYAHTYQIFEREDPKYIKDFLSLIVNSGYGFVAVRLTDQQIQSLLNEPKPLPADFYDTLTRYKDKGSHKEAQLDVKGEKNSSFIIYVRQSRINPFDFSVILGYRLPTRKNIIFRLRRYNGKHPSPHKTR